MRPNNKELKKKIKRDLCLPWWFDLVKWGIPYFCASVTAIALVLSLVGWVAMPVQAVPMLAWVEALFLAMAPPVKFIAVSLVGLGSFLSSLVISSVLVRGFLFSVCETMAIEGAKLSKELFEYTKDLQKNIGLQTSLKDQHKEQAEFLKGFAIGAKNNQNTGASEVAEGDLEEAFEEEQENDANTAADRPEPVVFRGREPRIPERSRSSTRSGGGSKKFYYIKVPTH